MEHARIEREELFMALKGGKGYTTADIESLPEGEYAELIEGEMFRMATPSRLHQDILMELAFEISHYIKKNKGRCKVYAAPLGVYIKKDNRNYVVPDISVICDRDKLIDKGCHGAPDWVVEIVSPSSKKMDYDRKTALYCETEVQEYWIVDPKAQIVTVHTACHWDKPARHSFSERIKVGIYEDLYINFSEMDLS